MYAIVQTGSKQYRVKKGDIIHTELLDGEIGQMVDLNDVLLIAQEDGIIKMGQPILSGCSVKAKYLAVVGGPKIQSIKYKRRKGVYRKFGHRQKYAQLQIVDINF
ncbi:MAG: 50S ribosomal protein L21 [Chlamydia sp.]